MQASQWQGVHFKIVDEMKKIGTFIFFILIGLSKLQAQTPDSTETANPFGFSIEEDMLTIPVNVKEDIRVFSSEKKIEKKEETVWQVYVLSQEQMQRAGANSVAEALRLVPSVLVRQKSNGHYHVQMKGLDISIGEGLWQEQNNNSLLVLVDNIPLNQYFNSEIYWESLPVAIQDIAKIEVMTAPLGTLYGYNALTGIVHIFTQIEREKGVHVHGNLQGGNNDSFLHQAAIKYGVSEKLNFKLAGSYWSNRRFQSDYYVVPLQRWTTGDSLLFYQANAVQTAPYTNLANQNYNTTAHINFQPSEKSYVNTSFGLQNTLTQDASLDIGTLAQTIRSLRQYYGNIQSKFNQLLVNANYQFGAQNLAQGYNGYQFNTNQLNASAEYQLQIKNLNITPTVYYGSASYEEVVSESLDPAYSLSLPAKVDFSYFGGGLRTSYSFVERGKIFAAVRYDNWIKPSQTLLNFSAGANYRVAGKHAIRIGYSTAAKAPSVYHLAFTPTQVLNNLQGIDNLFIRRYDSNPNLKPTKVNTLEGGFNWQIIDEVELHMQVFYQTLSQAVIPVLSNEGNTQVVNFLNDTDQITQTGINFSINGKVKNFDLYVFSTLQQTTFSNSIYPLVSNSPQWYGGFVLNYNSFVNRINFNVSGYALPTQVQNTQNFANTLAQQFVMNAKLAYQFWKGQSIFLNVRNWKANQSREHSFGELITPVYLVGINLMY